MDNFSKSKYFSVAISFAIGLFFTTNIQADSQTSPKKCTKTLTVEEFKAFALHNSPIVSEIDQQYATELKTAFDTQVLLNPEFQIEQVYTNEQLNGDNDSQSNISIAQPLRFSNFGSRSKLSSTIKNLGSVEKKIRLLELSQRVELSFYNLYILQETAKIFRDSENRANSKLDLIKQGVKKGQLSIGDEKIFEGEKYRLVAETKGIEAEIELLQADLAKLLGILCRIELVSKPEIDPVPRTEVLLKMAAENGLSELSRNEILDELVKNQIEVAKLDIFPQISPRLAYQHTNDGGDFFGFGIAMPLPVWNRNQGELIKLEADKSANSIKTSYLKDGGLELQIETLRKAATTSAEQFEIFSKKVVPSFEAALASQENLYLKGQGNVVQVWQSLRVLNESQLKSLSSFMQAASSRIKLSVIIGEEI